MYSTVTGHDNQKFAHCCFHKDKTPSVSVRDNKGSWVCFSCGKKGDIFTLIEQMEGLSFFESMKWLIQEFNIEPPERMYRDQKREQIKLLEKQGRIDEAFKILME